MNAIPSLCTIRSEASQEFKRVHNLETLYLNSKFDFESAALIDRHLCIESWKLQLKGRRCGEGYFEAFGRELVHLARGTASPTVDMHRGTLRVMQQEKLEDISSA